MKLFNKVQIGVVITGGLTITLLSMDEPYCKWGYVMGMISQPFHLTSTILSRQWGSFSLAIWYTIMWAIGIYNHVF